MNLHKARARSPGFSQAAPRVQGNYEENLEIIYLPIWAKVFLSPILLYFFSSLSSRSMLWDRILNIGGF